MYNIKVYQPVQKTQSLISYLDNMTILMTFN